MRYTTDKLLLLPPKTASRWCQSNVQGRVLGFASPDKQRHVALHQIPAEIRNGRAVYCLTRNPFAWYESWYSHMRRQPFAWSRQWNHEPVPPFQIAVRDYLTGWQSRDNGHQHDLAGGFSTEQGRADHLANQSRLRCGWWSYLMRWTVCDPLGEWNDAARFVFQGPNMRADLVAAGFDVGTGGPVGAGGYRAHEWTDELRALVMEHDGPTLELVNRQRVQANAPRNPAPTPS